jgi:hypothetical protein
MEPLSEEDNGIIMREVFGVVSGSIGRFHTLLYLKLKVFHYNMSYRRTVSNLLHRPGDASFTKLSAFLILLFMCYIMQRSLSKGCRAVQRLSNQYNYLTVKLLYIYG